MKRQSQLQTAGEDMKVGISFSQLTNAYAERSSAVGPNHIKSSPHIFGKTMWMLILVGGVGLTAYQTYDKILKYYKYDVKVETAIVFNREIFFPAVTICNLNPYRQNVLAVKAHKLCGILHNKTAKATVTVAADTLGGAAENASVLSFLQTMQTDQMQSQAWNSKAQYESEMADEMKMIDSVLTEVNQIDEATRKEMGHMMETMLIRCSFNGIPCTPSDFHPFLNWRHGNCFTFNSGWGNTTPVITRNPGSDHGLSMSFYIQTIEYVDALTETVGLKVILTDQNEMPFPEDEGTIISAGTHSQLTIQRLEVVRAGAPATPDCQSDHDNYTNYYDTIVPDLAYQEKTCLRTCVQKEINNRCHCRYAPYPGPSIRLCFPTDSADAKCTDAVIKQYRSGNLVCDCLAACNEVTYNTAASAATWPAGHAWEMLNAKLEREFPYLRGLNMTQDWARENFAKVDIFYPKLNFEKVVQSLDYGVLDLLSDIGGILGFWIGLSIASLLELVEFAVQVIVLVVTQIVNRQKHKVGEMTMITVQPMK